MTCLVPNTMQCEGISLLQNLLDCLAEIVFDFGGLLILTGNLFYSITAREPCSVLII